jgi:energy-coupling factor transporter ATP-binding protein EcfA2
VGQGAGERVVMRILNKASVMLALTDLGFAPDRLELMHDLIQRPEGIILVTGPTGSGKTTTLYACLNKLYDPRKKIITIEDPVEYELSGINQIPVNPKRGLTFATGLRAILRQDPDVIFVGEVRDNETVDIAIRSALTGHLLFTTLHTNDSISSVGRLVDMGAEPFLIASVLEGMLAQRLGRRLCKECVTRIPMTEEMAARITPEERLLFKDGAAVGKGNYRHFMEKELHEHPAVLGDTLRQYLDPRTLEVRLPRLPFDPARIPRLTLSACGSAFLAAHVGRYWIEQLARIPCDADMASELRYRNPPMDENTLVFAITQSGETADTLAALREMKDLNGLILRGNSGNS